MTLTHSPQQGQVPGLSTTAALYQRWDRGCTHRGLVGMGMANIYCIGHPVCVATSVLWTHSRCPRGPFLPGVLTSQTHTHEYFRRLREADQRRQLSARIPVEVPPQSRFLPVCSLHHTWIKGSSPPVQQAGGRALWKTDHERLRNLSQRATLSLQN